MKPDRLSSLDNCIIDRAFDDQPEHDDIKRAAGAVDPERESPEPDPQTSRCRSLWRAVILRAFWDAFPPTVSPSGTARRWLTHAGEDLEAVCDLAGLDADTVRGAARRMLDAGTTMPTNGA